MKRYESYKDSGVEWIGDVPSHWEINRMKYLFIRSKAGIWGEEEKGNPHDIVCFRIADFDYQHGCLKFDNLTLRNIEQKQLDDHILYKMDLLIEKSGGGDSTPVGRVVRYNYDSLSVCSNFIHFVSVGTGNYYNYIYYYFNSMYSNKINMLYFNQTTGIQNLKIGEYLSQRIYIPSFYEQRQIASYLDSKCGEVDKVISTQEKRIALLQELKQSIITHAVTKGLNPNVKMKDSGIEWIGEVPEHWVVRRIKNIISLLTDYDANGSFADIAKNCNINNGNPYAWMVRATDLENNRIGIVDGNNYCDKKTYLYLAKSSLCTNDILLAKRGEIGKSYLVPKCNDPMTLAPNTYLLITDKTKVDNKCLFYFFQSYVGVEILRLLNKSTTLGALYKDDVKSINLPLAPLTEQKEIASYLDKRCASIDASISKAQREIELLQEYKQSLITEVVTGKRKVC